MEHTECAVPGCERRLYAKGYCNAHYIAARKHPDEPPEALAIRSARAARSRTDDEMRADLLATYDVVGECWEWRGARDHRGYGNVRWKGKLWGAHRLTYHLLVEPVVRGLEVCHHCDNPPCIRPDHLYMGTHHRNMRDAAERGLMRGNGGRNGADNGRAKLTNDDVRAIRASGETQTALATRYGVSQSVISKVVLGKSYVSALIVDGDSHTPAPRASET